MKIYISGPITGTDDYMLRFAVAEERLQQEGHTVINPAKVSAGMPKQTSHEEYMKLAICMLDMCEAIFLMKNWNASEGATEEFMYAVDTGKVITFEQ